MFPLDVRNPRGSCGLPLNYDPLISIDSCYDSGHPC